MGSFKNYLKSKIYESDCTITEVAKKIGVSPQNLSGMLRRETIKYRLVMKIADILGYELKFTKKRRPII